MGPLGLWAQGTDWTSRTRASRTRGPWAQGPMGQYFIGGPRAPQAIGGPREKSIGGPRAPPSNWGAQGPLTNIIIILHKNSYFYT